MAASGLYLDRGLSPYHSPLAALLGSESPYTPHNAGQYAAYDEYDHQDGHTANTSSEAFATQDTLTSCAQYLEPVLQDLGLKQWQLQDGNPVAALNSLYELVQQHQALLGSKDKLQDELQKLKVDVKTADKTIQRLQCQSEQKAQEAGGLNIKLRQLDAWYREETERWTGEREQMAKKCAQMEQRHVQFQHELRRKDGEFEKLQKQLAAILSGSRRGVKGGGSSSTAAGKITTSSRGGITTCSSSSKLTAGNGPPDTRRATKAELEEIHKRVVEAYEADKQELLQDNAALRKALHELEREHKELLNTTEQQLAPSSRMSMASAAGSMTPQPDPAAALQHMHSKLEALKVRKQRITGGGNGLSELQELQQHAQSASERLLMAKLLEASNILEEQEAALVLALKAVPGRT